MSEPKKSRDDCHPFVTLDGSLVRELMHPREHGNHHQSLAEAIVPPGNRTLPHRHERSEEIYHFLSGSGIMELGDRSFRVTSGDTVCIAPGKPHALLNDGEDELRLLCCCAPPYSDEDTELLDHR
ncbi:MAG: cupin domain-containing protein [Gammaproteobacteria bacterium]|jgi:mannose-6-phosphate isomerase-like protein (cupin superfamily)|nr:cupin domain-containing protein [Gammaproteobacteria bacterium]